MVRRKALGAALVGKGLKVSIGNLEKLRVAE